MTGNELRRKVADIINAWDGATRGSAKHLEILNIYNNHKPLARGYRVQVGDAHCATTASAAYIKAGIAEYTGTECGVGKYVEIAKKKGIWTENDAYTPKVGDACVYDWQDGANYATTDNTGAPDHIGIVTKVGGGTFVVTEGNMNGGKVGKRTIFQSTRPMRGATAKVNKLLCTFLQKRHGFQIFLRKTLPFKAFCRLQIGKNFSICGANRCGNFCELLLRTIRSSVLPEGRSACSQNAQFYSHTFSRDNRNADCLFPDP